MYTEFKHVRVVSLCQGLGGVFGLEDPGELPVLLCGLLGVASCYKAYEVVFIANFGVHL